MIRPLTAIFALVLITGCAGTKDVAFEGNFPVPLIKKTPLRMGLALDETLTQYVYQEKIEKKGEWNVSLGPVQESLFTNLAEGMFTGYEMVAAPADAAPSIAGVDAILKPEITDLQFSLPDQTRSNFYEVWIRYTFRLYQPDGTLVSEWPLPAYGKASKRDFGNSSAGVKAAAIAACRDAMAFFALNFTKEPAVKKWLDGRASPPSQGPSGAPS